MDSNGLLPLRSTDRTFTAAYHFRRFLQKNLPEFFGETAGSGSTCRGRSPDANAAVDRTILERWTPDERVPLLKARPKDRWEICPSTRLCPPELSEEGRRRREPA